MPIPANKKVCPECGGFGYVTGDIAGPAPDVANDGPCPECGGTGLVDKDYEPPED